MTHTTVHITAYATGGKMKVPINSIKLPQMSEHRRALVLTILCSLLLSVGTWVAVATYAQTTSLRVQYRAADANSPNDNHLKPHLNIVNGSNTTVPLSELTVR